MRRFNAHARALDHWLWCRDKRVRGRRTNSYFRCGPGHCRWGRHGLGGDSWSWHRRWREEHLPAQENQQRERRREKNVFIVTHLRASKPLGLVRDENRNVREPNNREHESQERGRIQSRPKDGSGQFVLSPATRLMPGHALGSIRRCSANTTAYSGRQAQSTARASIDRS